MPRLQGADGGLAVIGMLGDIIVIVAFVIVAAALWKICCSWEGL